MCVKRFRNPYHAHRLTPAKVTTIYGSRKFFGSFICILLRFKTFLVPFKPFLLFIHFLSVMPIAALDIEMRGKEKLIRCSTHPIP